MNLIAERKIDELGRIVLPSEIRLKLGITQKSSIRIYDDGNKIVLEKGESSCRLCGGCEKLNEELKICNACIEKIKEY